MAANETFTCSVITPEKVVLECEAGFAAFPAHDGEVGVLPGRAPLVYKMGIGVLRVEVAGATSRLFVDGGFAQMADNRLTLLTEDAQRAEEIDPEEATAALAAAESLKITDDETFQDRQDAIRRAKARLSLAGG